MKNYYFLLLLFLAPLASNATVHTISVNGLAYTPDTITIQVGDSIYWDVTTSHPPREVSQSVYMANGNTSNGGFMAADQDTMEFVAAGDYYYVCSNHFSSGMKGLIIVESTAGIDQPEKVSYSIYPNPATEYTVLENVEQTQIDIFNALGQTVWSEQPLQNRLNISVQDWDKGAYFIRIRKGTAVTTKKLIVK